MSCGEYNLKTFAEFLLQNHPAVVVCGLEHAKTFACTCTLIMEVIKGNVNVPKLMESKHLTFCCAVSSYKGCKRGKASTMPRP